jgi:phenylalanyl-tRNA synthetase alpha chain
MRWLDEYFPFTDPSIELEILWEGKWIEILGSGVIHKGVIQNAELDANQTVGWAFGLGLERWAMKIFNIPHIKLFWSEDQRFLSQFQEGIISKFEPFSRYPFCYKDISFWIPENFEVNDFYEVVREIGGNMVENVECIDKFQHPKTQAQSHCYRIFYRDLERSLSNEEVSFLIY